MDYSIFTDTTADMNWMEIEEKSKAKVPVLFPLGVIDTICKRIKEKLNKKRQID